MTGYRMHRCPWPDCPHVVPLSLWGCRDHWYRLPKDIRNQILNGYRVGKLSPEHVEALHAADVWIAARMHSRELS